jgi:hypothetical protein
MALRRAHGYLAVPFLVWVQAAEALVRLGGARHVGITGVVGDA